MLLGLARTRQGVGLELAEVRVLGERVVLRRGDQQDAQRRILGHHVTGDLDGRRRQGDRLHGRADRIHHVHAQNVGGCNVHVARIQRERDDAVGAVGDEVAVLGRRLDGVHRHGGKLRVGGDRDAPLDVVVEATRASHVHQQGLVHVAVHQRLRDRAAQAAEIHGRADARHGVAEIDRETRLIDAHAGGVVAQAGALALGGLAAHDRVGADGLQELELDLIALAARQVHRLDDRQIGGGLLAHDFTGCGLALGHGAGQAAHGAVALHRLGKQARGEDALLIRGGGRDVCLGGHVR